MPKESTTLSAHHEFLQIYRGRHGDKYSISRGLPQPLGATPLSGGVNFAVFSSAATRVHLVLFAEGEEQPLIEFPLDPYFHRTGHIWHILISGIDHELEYGFRMDREPDDSPLLHRFDPRRVLIDPYARAVSGGESWGERDLHGDYLTDPSTPTRRRSRIVLSEYNWTSEIASNLPLADSIIYELHIRSFTRHPSSGVKCPGMFPGLVEKIDYLKDLGITAVELMPVTEFDEGESWQTNPLTGERLMNLWGYNPISFFAPKASYAAGGGFGSQVRQFKDMVRALHDAGIEVILDVVFNHTAEGNIQGPTLSFRGLDNSTYYMVNPANGEYYNYSGCGNTVNCNHPVVRDMILDCLRYWVMEMHVDGFRFDLASILGRGRQGEVLHNPPLLERIAADPVLANTKLIAEAWDAAGLYQVGHFPNWGRWAEWNGKFRDDIRRFVKGDHGMLSAAATRLAGSSDLYQPGGRAPFHSVNFITSHDGFTLEDLVSYNTKRNEANGESNTDGMNENDSWNCGFEGPTSDPSILSLRLRQKKNYLASLLLSRGVPMLLGGDEFGRTQKGNNNAYCQDNDISWVDWTLAAKNEDLRRFTRELIHLRRAHPILRYPSFLPDVRDWAGLITWHGLEAENPDWGPDSRCIAMLIHGGRLDADFYIALNMHWEPHVFHLPVPPRPRPWALVLDTARSAPLDIAPLGTARPLENPGAIRLEPRSMVVLRTALRG